ncbi:MAG: glycoside hydrolase [Actinomycetota bacterium]|nr:glycoside hydrolase [Actinomycetota bacterium]
MPNRRIAVRILPVIALLGFVLGIQPASAATSLSVGPNVDVSQRAGNEAETTISVNPTNPDNIVTVSNVQEGFSGIFEGASFDGGATWTRQIIADGDNLGFSCCDPSLAFDDYGNLFLTYLDIQKSGAKNTMVALSTDGGRNFRFLEIIDRVNNGTVKSPTKPGGGPAIDQPTIATGPGSVWVDVKEFNKKQLIIATGARVTGLGQVGSFFDPERVPGSRFGSFGDVVVGPQGEVMVTYQAPTGDEGPATISTNVDPDGLGPLGFGPAHFATNTNVGGFDYIPPQSTRSVDAESGLAWNRSGALHEDRVYLVYTNEKPNESNNTDIFVRHSDNKGLTWSKPVRVNDDRGTNSQFNPHISLDQTTGNVGVSFYDARNDLGNGGSGDTDGIPDTDAQYFAAVSVNAGRSFSPNVRVSKGTSNSLDAANGVDYGDYNGMSFDDGVMHPAWADNSDSTGDNPDGALNRLDIYTASVSVS